MAALVQGYPQQSGTVTALQTRPSSASGMLQSVPVQTTTHYLPGGSHRNSLHGLPATVTAPVVYRGGQVPAQQYAFRGMPSFNPSLPTMPWQQSRAQRTSSSPAVPTIQALDYMQPAVARSRYAASVSMTNLPSTANINLQMGPGTRDDSVLPVPGTRRVATAPGPRSPQPSSNGAPPQPTPAAAAPNRAAPERYRRSALRADSTPAVTTVPQLQSSQSATLNRPISFVGPSSASTLDDMGIAPAQPQGEIKRVRRRSMPALDSPGFPIHLTPHDFGRPAESIRPKSADMPAKTGNYLATDKTSKDEPTGAGRNPGANARPSSVSPCNPHCYPFPAPRTLAHCPITFIACLFGSTTDTEFILSPL